MNQSLGSVQHFINNKTAQKGLLYFFKVFFFIPIFDHCSMNNLINIFEVIEIF